MYMYMSDVMIRATRKHMYIHVTCILHLCKFLTTNLTTNLHNIGMHHSLSPAIWVQQETRSLKLGVFTGALRPGQVYSGGSSDAFCKYTGAKGKVTHYGAIIIFPTAHLFLCLGNTVCWRSHIWGCDQGQEGAGVEVGGLQSVLAAGMLWFVVHCRTFLVLPELKHEVTVWESTKS